MNLNNKHIVRIAATLALAGACTAAFAQSTEYRRGYQDGFAAGQRAAFDNRDRDRDRAPEWDRLHIDEAFYGAHGTMCDARRAVHIEAERNNGVIHVGNQLCGDPAPGDPKRLRIVYRCGDSQPARVVASENETLRLSCRR